MEKFNNGGFIQRKILAENTIVFETDSENPHMQYSITKIKVPLWLKGWSFAPHSHTGGLKLFVPKNTIIKNFSI